MPTEKTFITRIKNVHHTEAYWTTTGVAFVPKNGELVFYDADATHPYPRAKLGDGTTVIGSLPFFADSELTESEVQAILDDIF